MDASAVGKSDGMRMGDPREEEGMKIAVFCGAAEGNRPAYPASARKMGEWMAARGHELIYGAGKVGMMGLIADTVLSAGGRVTGVIPQFMVDLGWCHEGLSELIVTEDMSSRIKKMRDLSDAMIALPGGAGTLEEISCMISWQRLGLNDSPCVFYNEQGFYEPIREMYDRMIAADFLEPEAMERVLFSNDPEEIGRFIVTAAGKGRTASGGYDV